MEMNIDISGTTKLVGLIGSPVSQSMSPAMHTASFAKLGIDAVYLGFDVKLDQLADAVVGLKQLGAVGYNVTMPCKTYIGEYLDELSEAADLMGAVNTVVIEDGKSIGHNTDGAGFVQNIRNLGCDPAGKVVTVIGAGGAGSAVYTQVAIDGASEVRIFNQRDDFWDKTAARIGRVAEKTGARISLKDLADTGALEKSIAQSGILVNATRVGMVPNVDECLVEEEWLHEGLLVADTVYEPHETLLIKRAKARGLVTAGGLGMLLQQLALGEAIWFGCETPVEYLEKMFY